MRRIGSIAAAFLLALPASANAAYPGVNGRIAFASDRSGDLEIWSAETDGSGARQLTASPGADTEPDVSPDGSRIAFSSDRDGNSEIYVMNADGSGQTRLAASPGTEHNPRWSPDGARILFDSDRAGQRDLFVMTATGTGVQRITRVAGVDARGAWSPDAKRVAFQSNRSGNFEIYSASTAGGDLKRLTRSAGADVNPSYSPDGVLIAFDSTRSGGGDVYTMKAADGSGATRLTSSSASDTQPSYSPDGTRIAFISLRDGDGELFTMTDAGGAETQRTANGGAESMPAWGRLPASSPPQAGKVASVDVVKGTVTIQLPGSDAFVSLEDSTAIPIGSTLDTTKGTLRVVTSDAAGGSQTGDFYDGVFRLTQKKGAALTDLKLSGGSFKSCPKARKASAAKAKSVRHLWGKSTGKFRTTGRYASATVRGTTWKTDDRCDGTLVKVTSGSVLVRDRKAHRSVVVRRGKSYLAAARGR